MYKELDALKSIRCALSLGLDDKHCDYEKYNNLCDIIETALKNQKRKLDLISEVLVDVSKGNYADLNDAINEIREVLESE